MPTLFLFGASEGGLFDFDATLPLMAVQVVLLTFILNALFFKPCLLYTSDAADD